MCNDSFTVLNDDHAQWLQFSVDPLVARRVSFDDQVLKCAKGNVRIDGRLRVSHSMTSLKLSLPICSDQQCFEPIDIDVPISSKK